jgi:aminoglycoside 2'-N-acetyltransferase I
VLRDEETPDALLTAVRGMVVEAFDGRFSDSDWEHAAGGWRVVLSEGDRPVSHAAVVPRLLRIGTRELRAGYVEAVATRQSAQRQGHGSTVLRHVTSLVRRDFEVGALSTGRRDFYQRFGWEPWRGPSYVQHGDTLIRTADEDDGLMVLRCGPSAAVDLTDAIVCRSRRGEDW